MTINLAQIRSQLIILSVAAIALAMTACSQSEQPAPVATPPVEAEEAAPVKVPLTTRSDEARALYLEGRALADDLHQVQAREKFVAAVNADIEFAMGYFMLAVTSQTAAQFFDAVGKAEDYMGNVSDGEQMFIRALIATAENDQQAQFEALKKVMSAYPGDERTHMAMAEYFNGQQDFDNAVLHFGHATNINPDFASAFNSLGYAHRANGNLDGAKDAFARYVELIPDEANPYDSYAELLMEMGQYEASIENYQKALQMDPTFIASYAGISVNEALMGNAEAAQEAATDMLAMARTHAQQQQAMFRSATAHMIVNNFDAAIEKVHEMYAKAYEDNNHATMGGVHEYLGDIMMKLGESKQAIEYFDSSLKHRQSANINEANKKQAARAHLFKTAIASMIGGDSETAATRTDEYIAAAEADGTAFERRRIYEVSAFLAMNRADNEMAAAHFEKASQLNAINLYWAAVVNKQLGNNEKAAALARRATSRNLLSANMPFFRNEALALQDELKSM